MKKNGFILSLCLGILVLSSCNSDDTNNVPETYPLIATETTYKDGTLEHTFINKYNDNGDLLKRISIDSSEYLTSEYSYTNNEIKITKYNEYNVSHWETRYELDDNNLVSIYIIVEDEIMTVGAADYKDGYLVKEVVNIWKDRSAMTYAYTVEDGNTVSSTQITNTLASASKFSPSKVAGSLLPSMILQNPELGFASRANAAINKVASPYDFTYTFQFSNEKNTIGMENKGIHFMGKQNKNLINHYRTSDNQIVTFYYQFDDKKRVSKQSWSEGESDYYTKFTYVD